LDEDATTMMVYLDAAGTVIECPITSVLFTVIQCTPVSKLPIGKLEAAVVFVGYMDAMAYTPIGEVVAGSSVI
jgi:Na+-transporting NADH:ubiquinone oxidoreductase subunit NqrA